MINSLYPCFKNWSKYGSVWLISDTHFDDSDCKLMSSSWISPNEHISIIKNVCGKNDTLIHLGDVGNPEYLNKLNCYKVLIMGNHDESILKYEPYFNEIYKGPLMISEKLMLSHEPCLGGEKWFNIHGHCHDQFINEYNEINIASNIVDYKPINLSKLISNGILSRVFGLHRLTIDKAVANKNKLNYNE